MPLPPYNPGSGLPSAKYELRTRAWTPKSMHSMGFSMNDIAEDIWSGQIERL